MNNREAAKRGAAAMARATSGRARRFVNRKRRNNKYACRGKKLD